MAAVKVLGAILVLSGSALFGFRICSADRDRLNLLRELIYALEQLQGELELRCAPFPDLFLSVSKRAQGKACGFLRDVTEKMKRLGEESFAEIWSRQVQRAFPALSEEERDELSRLGMTLGKMDLEAELRALAGCRAYLGLRLSDLQEQLPGRKRLILGLSAAAGLVTVILMI